MAEYWAGGVDGVGTLDGAEEADEEESRRVL